LISLSFKFIFLGVDRIITLYFSKFAKALILVSNDQKERLIQREEVIRVLERASQDEAFWRELAENGSEALKEYRLSSNAKAAIVSGDLNWIRKHIGELTEEQLLFIHKRLERENW